MATYNVEAERLSARAATDLSTKQFYIVDLDVTGKIVLSGAGAGFGVLMDDPKLNEFGTLQFIGMVKVICGGAVNPTQYLSSDANGKAVPATVATVDTTVAAAARPVNGTKALLRALEPGVLNQIISAIVIPAGLIN